MGVTGLWTVVQPCARPIKLETLNKKRLAVDASIWIYQFLKAVRDKEGNALRNSHIVGFFRRICKLLYFGIRPVFVFDGGAPVMKRQTIAGRKKKREGHREDAARTAGKLLAVQMQRSAEEEDARRRNKTHVQEEDVPDAPVYAEEAFMTETEKQQSRKFKKKDAYHLPNLDVSLEDMGAPNDPRIMSQEELEEYARHFHQGQDINLYDFSKIDFDSMFFLSLPATDRYNILNAARLRSRLRMGYSKEQLDTMFPDRMAFSRFQIDRVAERNDLTQRLMNINGMNGEEAFYKSGKRIAGERGREYVLVKDSEHEGGWVLGVVGNREGHEDKPIDIDRPEILSDEDEVSEEDEFEDVPIEGLNRLPKLPFLREGLFDRSLQLQTDEDLDMRRAIQESRQTARRQSVNERRVQEVEDDSLFVQAEGNIGAQQQNNDTDEFFDGDDDDLERAIALSLQPDKVDDENMPDIPEMPIHRQVKSAPSYEMMPDPDSESDDGMDFTTAIARTKISKKASYTPNPFGGPLPFESIRLTKVTKDNDKASVVDEGAGGFVKEPTKKTKPTDPLPPWFVGEPSDSGFIADPIEDPEKDDEQFAAPDHLFLSNRRSPDIIDVDEISASKEVVDLDEEEEEEEEKCEHQDHTSRHVFQVDDIEKIYNELSTNLDEKKPLSEPAPAPTNRNIDETVVPGRPGTHIQEQVPALDDRSPRSEHSISPEFEDVARQQPTQGPEITVVSHQKAQRQPQIFEEVEEAFVQDHADYSDPEDEDLFKQLAAEGEEHVRFANTLNHAAPNQEAFDYEQELKQLRSQQRNERRDADEVTTIMINECQQLLTLFGLPYITAPMEAEAQCAKLVSLGLVDGIVTDDSDIFLFGGTRVYKNMFNQSKFVECYLTSDLEKEYALHRQKLISFAHLLGSDYTEGIPGIGPVTALEILTEFSNLEEFRDWWAGLQMGTNNAEDAHLAFRKKFRKKASKIFLPPSFPDPKVDEAYLEPVVDDDPSQFQWGVPDLNGLRTFLMTTIGWTQERTDEVLVPVIRDMNRRGQEGTQSNITQFMQGPQGAGAFAPRVRTGGPSRMEKAFGRLRQEAQTGGTSLGGEPAVGDGEGKGASVSQKKGKRNTSTAMAKADTNKKRKTRRADSPGP